MREENSKTVLTIAPEETRRPGAATPEDDHVTWEEFLEEELERQKWLVWEAWRVGMA